MFVLGLILYYIVVVSLGVSLILLLAPLLIGMVISIAVNIISIYKKGRAAPVIWNILTGLVTVFATGMLWKDIFNDSIDRGMLPFVILAAYGLGSLIFIAIPKPKRKTKVIVRKVKKSPDS